MDKDIIIHNPEHYTFGRIQPIDAIQDWGLNFCLGNVIKYVARADHKGTPIEDLKKARQYIDFELRNRGIHED